MSGIIGSAAFFKSCACGKHGRIVLAGGETGSQNLSSKEAALVVMDAGVEKGLITEDEHTIH